MEHGIGSVMTLQGQTTSNAVIRKETIHLTSQGYRDIPVTSICR